MRWVAISLFAIALLYVPIGAEAEVLDKFYPFGFHASWQWVALGLGLLIAFDPKKLWVAALTQAPTALAFLYVAGEYLGQFSESAAVDSILPAVRREAARMGYDLDRYFMWEAVAAASWIAVCGIWCIRQFRRRNDGAA